MWEPSICSKTVSFSPRGQMGMGMYLLHCLFLVLVKSSRSCYGSRVLVYIVLGSLRIWVVKPLVFIFLTFPDVQGGREDISLIRVNESMSCTCCSEALLSLIHITAAAKEHIPRAPWCGPRVLYLYRLLQCVRAGWIQTLQLQLSQSLFAGKNKLCWLACSIC